MKLERPTFQDVLEARSLIKDYLPRTPLYSYPQINQRLDAKVYIKHENFLPTGAFKTRGGINLIHNLNREQKERGVVTASTGNHALSIAYASSLFRIPATIVMPEKSNPLRAIGRIQHLITCLGEHQSEHSSDNIIIIYDQNPGHG